ncbi:MAG: hypothetical protein HQL74_13760 [Magnetococcales bacterium]|nr:hypothetical protein [Magnetococcales bacterium]
MGATQISPEQTESAPVFSSNEIVAFYARAILDVLRTKEGLSEEMIMDILAEAVEIHWRFPDSGVERSVGKVLNGQLSIPGLPRFGHSFGE